MKLSGQVREEFSEERRPAPNLSSNPEGRGGEEGEGRTTGGRARTGRTVGTHVALPSNAHDASWWRYFQMKVRGALASTYPIREQTTGA